MQGNNRIAYFFTRNAAALLVLLFAGAFVFYFYGPVLTYPGDYLLANSGDALKNYYCFEWHVKHDTSFINYTGSNYPFGEQHIFTDGNPLLSNSIKLLPFLKEYSIAILNLSLLLSFLLCALLLYKIFRHFKIANLYAIIASLGITILCPQVFRLSGHFSLAYNFCLPLIIYLLLKFESEPGKGYRSYLVGLSVLCFLFIHPYLGIISASFLFLYWLINGLASLKTLSKNAAAVCIQVVIPLVIYFLYTKLTDTHTDRVSKPYGFFHYTSSIESVFISTQKPFRHFLSLLYPVKKQNTEGLAYVGITSLVAILFILLSISKKRSKIRLLFRESRQARSYLYMVLASTLLLLFSMGLPFKWHMQRFLDYFPLLTQFRSPGRFAWMFYFITTIGATLIITTYFVDGNKKLKIVLCAFMLLLFTIEGIPFHKLVSKNKFTKNYFKEKYLDKDLKTIVAVIKKETPQALIPLPFFHFGTDYYNIPGTEKIISAALLVCYHSQVPLMAGITGRTSLSEAEKLIQLISKDFIEKEIGKKIKSLRPFILLYSKELLSEEEMALLEKGKTIFENDNYLLKRVTKEELFSNSGPQKWKLFYQKRKNLISRKHHLLSDSSWFYFCGFDSLPGKIFTGNAKGNNTLVRLPGLVLKKNALYELSFWYKTRDRLDLDNILSVNELRSDERYTLAFKNIKAMSNLRSGRTFATLSFSTEFPENRIEIVLNGISDRERLFYLDDLMIREKTTTVYNPCFSMASGDSGLIYNNVGIAFPIQK